MFSDTTDVVSSSSSVPLKTSLIQNLFVNPEWKSFNNTSQSEDSQHFKTEQIFMNGFSHMTNLDVELLNEISDWT